MNRSAPLLAGWLTCAAFFASPPRAAISIYVPPEALAAAAPVVVEGTVERVASGYDPVNRGVATYVTLRVAAVHRGPDDLDRVVLREPGGHYGGIVHEVDAVPLFRVGEQVLVFAESARDGALRTAGMFFGKYVLLDGPSGGRRALREMSGRGLILRAPPEVMEEVPLPDLIALVATTPLRAGGGAAGAVAPKAMPPELERIVWEPTTPGEPEALPAPARAAAPSAADLAATEPTGPAPAPDFVPFSSSYPARWDETDAGVAIPIDVEQARNPLGDGAAALAEVARAMAAWTAVPESRLVVRVGNPDAAFTAANPRSPALSNPPGNIVLFGDPYDDLSDPIGCAGTIAFGGYWRASVPGRVVNGVAFFPIRRLYVIFNRAFECFLGDPRNLAEIAAHELGHGIGLGHSTTPDAIMRSWAYGDRGAELGADDRDAVHCVYPHAFTVVSPNGGESWTGGTIRTITWTSSVEAGSDPGTVDLAWSNDAGVTWRTLAVGERNDGNLRWVVPNVAGVRTRVRVARRTTTGAPSGVFPAVCSQDSSNASFTIRPGGGPAGRSPDGSSGPPLRIARAAAGALSVSWGASCGTASNYALYEGSLDALRSGIWDHTPLTCKAGSDLSETVTPAPGNRYYLAAPTAGQVEGSLGTGSAGSMRPASENACGLRESSGCP